MQEHARAVAKFPGPNVNMTALVEESGELVDALVGYLAGLTSAQGRLARVLFHFRPDDGGDSTWAQVRKEAVQVAVMAIRVALEGDSTLAQPAGPDALQVPSQDNVVPLTYPAETEPLHQLLDVTLDIMSFLDLLRRGAYENCGWVHDQAATLWRDLDTARERVKRSPAPVLPLNDQAVRDERQALNDLAITTAEICQFLNDLATGPYGPNLSGRAGRLQNALEAHRLVALRLRDKPVDEIVTGPREHDWIEGVHGKICKACREVRPHSLQPGDIMGYHTMRYGDGPARREPLRYQPDDICDGPAGENPEPITTINRSHVAMDRFPLRGSTMTLRVVHWREGVERMSGGDLYHLERLDQDTGKWREMNPPLDMQAGKMADLLASATAWLKEHDVKVVWSPKVFASETERLLAPVTMDTAPAGAAIRVDGKLFTDVQIRELVARIQDEVRTGADMSVTNASTTPVNEDAANPYKNGTHAVNNALSCLRAIRNGADHGDVALAPGGEQSGNYAHVCDAINWLENHPQVKTPPITGPNTPAPVAPADEPVIFASTVPPLPDGAAIIAIHTNKRMLTATLEPNATHYRVEGKDLVADWTLVELLRNAGLLDPVNEERITTQAGLCRMVNTEGRKDEEAWGVEQFNGKHWQTIASKISYGFAAGVFMRRMKERFPVDQVFNQTEKEIDLRYIENYRKRHDKVREAFRTILDKIKKNGGLIDEDDRNAISLLIEDTTNALQGF